MVVDRVWRVIICINFVFLSVVTYCRYCHYGKVCSGDYLYEDFDSDVDREGYVNVEGTWLQTFTIVNWVKTIVMITLTAIFRIKQVSGNAPQTKLD